MPLIAPSILSADFARLAEDIRSAESAGADWIHVDVMDGRFVPNITIGPLIVEAVKRSTHLPLDVHLMIEEPERYIEDFARAGADRITVHAEASVHLHRTLQQIRAAGALPGVSLNPSTPLSAVECVLAEMDMVLIMSVNPGFGGQSFIPASLGKLSALQEMVRAQKLEGRILVEIDGGVGPSNALDVIRAGADVLVMGSAFFGAKDRRGVVEQIRSLS